MTTAHSSGRRRLLLGIGALGAAPVVVPLLTTTPAHAADGETYVQQDGSRSGAEPSCLADLVANGEVRRADFMVG